MEAAVGRTVLALVDPEHNNGQDVAPAIITRVWDGGQAVDLRILFDGPAIPPEGSGRRDWMTSVRLRPTREVLEAEHAHVDAVWQAGGNGPVELHYFGAFWPSEEA